MLIIFSEKILFFFAFLSPCAIHRGGKGPYLPALFLIAIHGSKEAETGISVYLISGSLQGG